MGYMWNPVLRVHKRNGGDERIDLVYDFQTPGNPVSIEVSPRYEILKQDDVNRNSQNVVMGIRYEVTFTFDIVTMDDHATLTRILRSLAREDHEVHLALDSVKEKVVQPVENPYSGPKPFNGRPQAGARFSLTVQTKNLEKYPAPIGEGLW